MKPFDLAAAKRGEKLVTRDGRKVSEFYHFETARNTDYPCCAVIDGEREFFTEEGKFFKGDERENDLFIAPKTRTVFVQIFNKSTDSDVPALRAVAFESKGDAEDNVKTTSWPVLVVAHPVEIEE